MGAGCCGSKNVVAQDHQQESFTDLSDKKDPAFVPQTHGNVKAPKKLERYATTSQGPVSGPSAEDGGADSPVKADSRTRTPATTAAPSMQKSPEAPKVAAPVATDLPAYASYRDRLVVFFTKYNPNRLDFIDTILEQYVGREDILMESLVIKYGPEPGREGQSLAVAAVTRTAPPSTTAAFMPNPVPAPNAAVTQPVSPPTAAPKVETVSPAAPSVPINPTPSLGDQQQPPPTGSTAAAAAPAIPLVEVSPAIITPSESAPIPTAVEEAPAGNVTPRPEPKKFLGRDDGNDGMEELTIDDMPTQLDPGSIVSQVEAFQSITTPMKSPETVESTSTTLRKEDATDPDGRTAHAMVPSGGRPSAITWWQNMTTVTLKVYPNENLSVALTDPAVLRIACVPHYDMELTLSFPCSAAVHANGPDVVLTKADRRNWLQLIATKTKEEYFAMGWIRREVVDEDSSSEEDD